MKFAIFTIAAAFFGAVSAAPFIRNTVQRDIHELGVRFIPRDGGLPTYPSIQYAKNIKRDDVNVLGLRHIIDEEDLAKRGDRITPKIINREPGQGPAPDSVNKRQISAEIPVKSLNGNIIPYVKRQEVPVEVAVKSVNGNIVPYVKRQEVPVEVAVKSVNGNIVPYVKRQDVPVEVAVKSVNGEIVPY